ncbi:MAG: hypothetical protein R3E84_14490 [Pseudomonadales bacterium]
MSTVPRCTTSEIERNGLLWYADNPYAAENKQALQDLQAHAARIGAGFAVVVIPPREHVDDAGWHAEVHAFLEAQGIRYLDLADTFKALGASADTVFLLDGHFNSYGNKVVADALESRFRDLFDPLRTSAP